MKKIFIVCLLFLYMPMSSFTQKGSAIYDKNVQPVSKEKLTSEEFSRLEKEIDSIKIEKNFYQTLLQNTVSTYSVMVGILLALAGLTSFGYFISKAKKIEIALEKFSQTEKKLQITLEELNIIRNDSYYTYANVCGIYGGLECKDPYFNYNKSFYYYMRCIKYLMLSGKESGIIDNLENADSVLKDLINASLVSSQEWKLEKRHITEIREILIELTKVGEIKTKQLADKIFNCFESNLEKAKG